VMSYDEQQKRDKGKKIRCEADRSVENSRTRHSSGSDATCVIKGQRQSCEGVSSDRSLT